MKKYRPKINLLQLLFIIALFAQYNFVSAQYKSGTVIYEKMMMIDLDELKQSPKDKMLVQDAQEIIEDLKSMRYVLKFNKNEAVFKLREDLEPDSEKDFKLAKKLGGGDGVYYTNLIKQEVLHQKEFMGETFLISERIDAIKWKTFPQVKLVGKYTCLKATADITIQTRRGPKKQKITAWYAPKIPFQFGPIGYAMLPGLILELQVGVFLYRYQEINLFTSDKVSLKAPAKGRKFTKIEYENMIKERFEDRGSLK